MPLPPEFSQSSFWSDAPEFPPQFAIVTAYNPDGRTVNAAQNAAADDSLRRKLEAKGFIPFRVTGGSRDRSHLEPGWAFADNSPDYAISLAREYGSSSVIVGRRGNGQ